MMNSCYLMISCVFYLRIILHHLGTSLPHEDGFSKVKSSYNKSACYSIYDNYDVNVDGLWLNGDWFYTTKYSVFGDEGKANLKDLPEKNWKDK